MTRRQLPVAPRISRRAFATLVGAGLSAACRRAPEEEIIPYVSRPPELIPGRTQHYATTLTRDGFGIGVLAACHGGRPTKLEGNPEHPASTGASGRAEQAALLDLYSEQRCGVVSRHDSPGSLTELRRWLRERRATLEAKRGEGLAIVLPPSTSPLLARTLDDVRQRLPRARVHFLSQTAAGDASRLTFGRRLEPIYDLALADRVCCIDSDFLAASGPMDLRYCGQWGERRRLQSAEESPNRLYVLESSLSVTGASADRRFPVDATDIHGAMADLLRLLETPTATSRRFPFLRALADDLSRNRRRSLVLCGPRQPAPVQVLCHAVNRVLESPSHTLRYVTSPLLEGAPLSELWDALDAGAVELLITLDVDPIRRLPADLQVAARMKRAKEHLALCQTRGPTAAQATWLVPAQHPLERWGDARAQDGSLSLSQPLLEPLGESLATEHLLTLLIDEHPKQDKAALEATWTSDRIREATATGSVDEWLSRGIAPGSALPSLAVDPDEDAVNQARQVSASASNLCLELAPDPRLELGERQDNDWLQELPDPITRLCWGNALFVPDAVAKKHDLSNRDMVELRAGDVRLRVPIWIKPGQAERTLSIWLGHGERAGVDAAPVRSSGAPWLVRGIEITPLDERDDRLVCVQSTTSQEGRPLALSMHLSEWRTEPERLRRHNEDPPSLHPKRLQGSPQWGMVIDLNACTGCSVCVLACQAENNTPSVGPADASLGRAMHWLRIDRYFAGDSAESMAQPMACQHCEKAPCEYVCPVGATTHSPDGLNEMTYNRCVGTRFCSNNCPYKVRRFNWREYAPTPGERRVLLENPNVTVRARGVMEKCTYCVQRIRRAEIDCKLEHRELRDGDVATACEQACPTRAIVFGDISDPRSRVSERRGSSRLYGVLAEEGTRPRTRYLARIKNSPEEDT